MPINLTDEIDFLPVILLLISDIVTQADKHVLAAKLLRAQVLLRVNELIAMVTRVTIEHPDWIMNTHSKSVMAKVELFLIKEGLRNSDDRTVGLVGMKIS